MKSRRFIHSSTDGLTLVELLIALAISALVIGLVLPMLLSHQRLVKVDQARTEVFQNLRSAMEIVGTDVRIAGERLDQRGGPNIFPIEIIPGDNGEPDELVLRRNLLDYALPVCDNIDEDTGEHNIKFRRKGKASPWNEYSQCEVVPNDPAVDTWEEYLAEFEDGTRAYIFDPNSDHGEFFTLKDIDSSTFQLHRADNESWQYSYGVSKQDDDPPPNLPNFYILEERRYQLDKENNILELVINGEDAIRIVGNIVDFQVRAVLDDDDQTELEEISAAAEWRNLRAIKVLLESESVVQDETLHRQLESRFFPRNVLSDR